jgi:hypothetical protein
MALVRKANVVRDLRNAEFIAPQQCLASSIRSEGGGPVLCGSLKEGIENFAGSEFSIPAFKLIWN